MISVLDSSNILTMYFSNISNLFQFFFRHDNWLTSQEIDIYKKTMNFTSIMQFKLLLASFNKNVIISIKIYL